MRVNAERVKLERLNRGWTQEQLAAAAGVSLRTVQRIESQAQASNESISALCAVFTVTRGEITVAQTPVPLPRSQAPVIAALLAGVVFGTVITLLLTRWLL